MSFSDDPTSPAAPFSGDSTGQIFDMPDMVATSPTTSERVLDTQSGFLLVVKKLGDKLALSVKRQIGTPPSSSVTLTPDESVKLSRILASSFSADDLSSEFSEHRASRRRRGSKLFGGVSEEEEVEKSGEDLDQPLPAQALSSVPVKLMLASVLRAFMVPILGITLSVFALGIGAGVGGLKIASKPAPIAPLVVDPLETAKVDTFVRDFVSKMLDFSSKTYRISQIQAMAAMSPDLVERYWQETRFPLTKRQLSGMPQGANIGISELKQERVDSHTVVVDVHAQLSDANNPKVATPVNLRLKLDLDANHQIVVTDQQDLSTGSSK